MARVLIVDDEKDIRNGLSSRVPWKEWGIEEVCTAEDGEQALEYISSQPFDIVITDIKMGQMSGIELVRTLHRDERFAGKTIIISGYDDFQYAKDAIQIGVVDYLLKPINLDELRRVVQFALQQLEEERKRTEAQRHLRDGFTEILPKLRGEVLQELIEKPFDLNMAARISGRLRLAQLDWLLDRKVVMMLMEVDDMKALISGKPASEADLLRFAVGNVLEQSLREEFDWQQQIFRTQRDQWVILLACDGLDPARLERIKSFSRTLNERMCKYVKARISITLAPVGPIDRFYEMYCEAVEALMYKKIYGLSRDIVVDKPSLDVRLEETVLADPDAMADIVMLGNKQDIADAMNAFADLALEWNVASIRDLQQRSFEWLIAIFRAARKRGWREEGWDRNAFAIWEELEKYDTLESLKRQLTLMLTDVSSTVAEQSRSTNQIVQQAETYIRQHYADNLTLEHVAGVVHVTPVWLSKLFKKETKLTFLEYVTEVRLTKAAELLKKTNDKIYQICDEIGYQDPVHFARMFKRKYGCNPTEYRNGRTNRER